MTNVILLQQLFAPSKTFFILIFLHLIFFEAMAYFTMYYFGTGWLPYLAAAVFYVIALVCVIQLIPVPFGLT